MGKDPSWKEIRRGRTGETTKKEVKSEPLRGQYNLPHLLDPVHFREHLREDSISHSSSSTPSPPRRDRIDLVEKDDSGSGGPRAPENLPNRAFALAHVLVKQLRT